MPVWFNRPVRYFGAVALGVAVFAGAAYSTQMSAGKVVAAAPVAVPTRPSFLATTSATPARNIDMAPFAQVPEAIVAPAPQVASLDVSAPTAPPVDAKPKFVTLSGVNVRSGPSSSADPLFTLDASAVVQVADNQHGWSEVTDAQGRTGWVWGKYLKPAD